MHNHSFSTPLKLWFRASRYPDQTLGQRIKKARLERELFQKELAKMMEVSKDTVKNWENETTTPVKMYRGRIKKYLGVRV
jgi:DNA-binding transcriptional regulator YiaG